MKNNVHPGIVAVIVIALLAVVGWWGIRTLQPSQADSSPGSEVSLVDSEKSAAAVPPTPNPGEAGLQTAGNAPAIPQGENVAPDGTAGIPPR